MTELTRHVEQFRRDPIDRVAPTQRPPRFARGRQRWRDLLFLHWPVSPESIRPLVPAGLEVDVFDGHAWVGLVPFRMEGVRAVGVPEPLSFSFAETNVRTYVHAAGRDPGVLFLSLDAGSLLAVIGARAAWSLPYHHARADLSRDGLRFRYDLERRGVHGARLQVEWDIGERLGPAKLGTLEYFLVERYLLHVERLGRLCTGQVHHQPYPLQRAHVLSLKDELVAAAGIDVSGDPLAHYAAGVDVEVFSLRRQGSR
jgi:hypothetical protein